MMPNNSLTPARQSSMTSRASDCYKIVTDWRPRVKNRIWVIGQKQYTNVQVLVSNRRSRLFQPRSQLASLQSSPRDSEFYHLDIEMN